MNKSLEKYINANEDDLLAAAREKISMSSVGREIAGIACDAFREGAEKARKALEDARKQLKEIGSSHVIPVQPIETDIFVNAVCEICFGARDVAFNDLPMEQRSDAVKQGNYQCVKQAMIYENIPRDQITPEIFQQYL